MDLFTIQEKKSLSEKVRIQIVMNARMYIKDRLDSHCRLYTKAKSWLVKLYLASSGQAVQLNMRRYELCHILCVSSSTSTAATENNQFPRSYHTPTFFKIILQFYKEQ